MGRIDWKSNISSVIIYLCQNWYFLFSFSDLKIRILNPSPHPNNCKLSNTKSCKIGWKINLPSIILSLCQNSPFISLILFQDRKVSDMLIRKLPLNTSLSEDYDSYIYNSTLTIIQNNSTS